MGYNSQEIKKKDDYVSKNFLLVSLEEKKTKKIAEVINNETSRKIIDYLAKNDSTESELSKDLNIPISTIHYNLKLLQEAGLVVVEEFHYSKKGKEVNHYALANKYIIIAPKSQDSRVIDALKKVMPFAIITVAVAFVMQLFSLLSASKLSAGTNMAAKYVAEDSAQSLMAAAPAASAPVVQSNPIAYFIFGAIAVLIIYFIYEWTRKN